MALLLAVLMACGVQARLDEGDAALAKGDLVAAEVAFRQALEREPDEVAALYGLGWTLHLAGDRDLARANFQRVTEVAPENPLGWKGLGSVAMAEGNARQAERSFREALTRAPGDVAIRHSLALLELSAGKPDAALATLDALVNEAPARGEVHLARAQALAQLKRLEEALTAVGEAVTRADTPRASAQAKVLRARILLLTSAGRVRAEDCATTAPPVLAWLDDADRTLDEVEASGVVVPELHVVRRTVRGQRGAVHDACPLGNAGG